MRFQKLDSLVDTFTLRLMYGMAILMALVSFSDLKDPKLFLTPLALIMAASAGHQYYIFARKSGQWPFHK
jgi:hypothetical protein